MYSKLRFKILLIILVCAAGCSTLKTGETQGESRSSYTYIPVDPFPIFEKPGIQCQDAGIIELKDLLSSLPDQAVRLAVGEYNESGSISFGPAAIGVEGKSYEVILDYISADITFIPVYAKEIILEGDLIVDSISLYSPQPPRTKDRVIKYKITPAPRMSPYSDSLPPSLSKDGSDLFIIPVYIGVGLRLTASVHVQKGKVNLTSLGALSAGAEAGKLTGTLIIQTLGITGNNVNKILPLPSEINQSTIQNAILSLGSIKAILYDESTIITPRVVGIYNPIRGGQEVVNGIISQLVGRPVTWYRPCKQK